MATISPHSKLTRNITVLLSLLICAPAWSGDLDDDIGGDEPINDTLTKDQNIQFTVVNAKAKAAFKAKNGISDDGVTSDGVGNINIGIGADLSGATIINVSDNDDVTVVDK